MKVHSHSSQIVFLSRQSLFFTTSSMPHEHVFSSHAPALRAASSGPSAVGPDGPWDLRDSSPDTPVDHLSVSVDEERAASRQWQDNAVLRTASPASSQPAPGTEGVRRAVSDTGSARVHNSDDWLRRSSRLTLRVRPGVKTAIARIAHDDEVSLSEACDTGLAFYARARIHDQEETLFVPRMQAMMRREIRSSDDRHLPFEIRNAIAAEQTRMIVADLYQRLLAREGLSQEQIRQKLRKQYTQARINIFKITPQMTAMLAEYWQRIDDQADQQVQGAQAHEPSGRGGTGSGTLES
jgi:hypothetical protein